MNPVPRYPVGPQWEDVNLLRDPRIWDMAMRLASIPVEDIALDSLGQIITDGPTPTPTDRFTQLAGFEYVRRGGHVTAEVDAMAIASAVLKIRTAPIDELLALQRGVEDIPGAHRLPLIDPSGNGPIDPEPA
jgi:hypothetical protein